MRISDWSSDVCSSDLATRRITNVSDGIDDNDAVNVAQLQEVAKTEDNTDHFFQASDDPDNPGVGAYVEGINATAAGENANASGDGASAYGRGAYARGGKPVAMGQDRQPKCRLGTAHGLTPTQKSHT